MSDLLHKIFAKIRFFAQEAYLTHIARDPHTILVRKWHKDTKFNDFRFIQKINSCSVVMDVGGYLGDWSDEINKKYHPNLYVYEPVPFFYASLESRFSECGNVRLKNYGLSDKSALLPISIDADGSSLFSKSSSAINIEIRDIIDEMVSNNIKEVDLIKINIEGAEYDLLERIIECGLLSSFKVFQIQFHNFVEGASLRRTKIRDLLSSSHTLKYDYPFIWEEWVRKDIE